MNRQQRHLLIAVSGMLALVLLIIVIVLLNRRGDKPPDPPAVPSVSTEVPDAPENSLEPQPKTEEEMGRQALSEEENDVNQPDSPGEGELTED